MNYLSLNLLMIIPALILAILAWKKLSWSPILLTLAALLVLTAVFDNLIVGSGIVAYNEELISGIRIGVAPIEDFFYTVFAAVVIPICWKLFGAKK